MIEKEILSAFEPAKIVRLRPGDVLLFRCPARLTKLQCERVKELLTELFPGNESVILHDRQDIAVMRPDPGVLVRLMKWFRRRS